MAGRVNDIFGLGTLAAKVDALNQLATDVFEAREDPIQLTRALPQIFQHIFSGADSSTYARFLASNSRPHRSKAPSFQTIEN